jgi:hypothetical protein
MRMGRAVAALAVMMAAPAAVSAQELTAYATASVDGDESNIQLVGASARPEGLGLRPVVAVQAYRLNYDAGGESTTVWSVGPSVGGSYRMEGGQLEGRVGYNFQSEEVDSPLIGEGGGSGFTTAVQAISWASRPELQGIASYGWGSEYLWSQAQAILPVAELSPGSIGVGAEAVWQGNVGGEGDYEAWQVGPVVRWSTGHESNLLVGAGYKNSSSRDATWYARVGFVKYGMSLGLF